jgi:hypothetical protein
MVFPSPKIIKLSKPFQFKLEDATPKDQEGRIKSLPSFYLSDLKNRNFLIGGLKKNLW